MIYMDNAATTMQKPPQVAEAVVRAMGTLGNAGRGASEASLGAARVIYETREQLCRLFHGEDPRQIVFTLNATESLNTAIGGLIDPGDHVITTAMEHNSVLRPLYACGQTGTEVTILRCDEKGNISYEKLEAAIRENTKAIICTHGSNLTGNLNDAKKSARSQKSTEYCLYWMRRRQRGMCRSTYRKCRLTCYASPDIKDCSDRREPVGCMCVRECRSVR